MKKLPLTLLFFFSLIIESFSQKLDSLISRSYISFNYGLAYDPWARKPNSGGPPTALDIGSVDSYGQIFGFEYGLISKNKKNEWGMGFSKQINRREYNAEIQTRYALIEFEKAIFRDIKNIHYLYWKRHFITDRLIGTLGMYNVRFRDSSVGILNNADQTIIEYMESHSINDLGLFLGIEFFKKIGNCQIGLKSRLFYSYGYGNVFESFEITPVIRFKL
jgi:hypothetical protein